MVCKYYFLLVLTHKTRGSLSDAHEKSDRKEYNQICTLAAGKWKETVVFSFD